MQLVTTTTVKNILRSLGRKDQVTLDNDTARNAVIKFLTDNGWIPTEPMATLSANGTCVGTEKAKERFWNFWQKLHRV